MIAKNQILPPRDSLRVAVPEWSEDDGIAKMIGSELEQMGYDPILFSFDRDLPGNVDYLLTFGPYNTILPLWQQNAGPRNTHRPVVIHWNTEGMPDLRIPPIVVRVLGSIRSRFGRMGFSSSAFERFLYSLRVFASIDQSFKRYRYHGDYEYGYRKNWLDVLADTSHVYSQIRSKIGVPTLYAPWGASKRWYKDLDLRRDIDVLWMGTKGTERRGRILDQVFGELKRKGLNVYVGDNEERPFIFGEERIKYLNRAKITLNVTRTWYDDNYSRFAIACPNRSLIVSEPLLPHCPEFKANVHYVSAEIPDLVNKILYYLEHEEQRMMIVKNAHDLMVTDLQFNKSLGKMFAAAHQRLASEAATRAEFQR